MLTAQKVFAIVLGAGVVVMPFVWWPSAPVAYELPRVWFVHRWVEVLFLISLIGMRELPRRSMDVKLLGGLIMYVVVAIVASVVGVDVVQSWVGNYWRGDGLVTLFRLMGLALVVGLWWDKNVKNILVWATSGAVGVMSGWVIFSGLTSGFEARGLAFGNPVLMAGWLVVASAWVVNGVRGRMGVVLAGVCSIALAVLQVWSVVLVWGVFLAIRFKRLRLVFGLGVVMAGLWWWSNAAQVEYLRSGAVNYESRERIFRKVWGGFLQRPILGWGWANVDAAFNAFVWPYPIDNDVYLDKAHSSILENLATVGVVGLGIYALVIVRTGVRVQKKGLLAVLVVYLLHAQTNVVGVAQEVYLWLLVGAALAE